MIARCADGIGADVGLEVGNKTLAERCKGRLSGGGTLIREAVLQLGCLHRVWLTN